MATQRIVWTAIPYGFSRGALRASIVVSPQLKPESSDEEQLGAFPDFIDWPASLAEADLAVLLDGQRYGLRMLSRPDSALWKRVFTRDVWVDEFRFKDMSAVNLRSFPVRDIVRCVRDHYGRLADEHALDRPPLFPIDTSALHGLLCEVGGVVARGRKADLVPKHSDGFSRLLSGGELDRSSTQHWFGDDPFVPPTVIGTEGRPTKNTRGLAQRTLPRFEQLSSSEQAQVGSATQYAFFQANRFYSRTENRPDTAHRKARYPDPEKARLIELPRAPRFDFHRMIAALSDAPALARDLGLVLDVELLDSESLMRSRGSAPLKTRLGELRVDVKFASRSATSTDVRPRTAYRLTPARFLARELGAEHREGLLRLQHVREVSDSKSANGAVQLEQPFDLVQIDPDGSAIKLINTTLTLQNHLRSTTPAAGDELSRAGKLTYTTTGQEGVPALRSGGIAVVHNGRAQAVATAAQGAALKRTALESTDGNGVLLFTEDLLRGYRLDVDDRGQWRSLCTREVRYTLRDDGSELRERVRDEGYVKGASTTSSVKDPANAGPEDHYLHETMFKWSGWSLAAPRPGRRIVAHNEHGLIQEEKVEYLDPVTDTAPDGVRVVSHPVAAPGSLPALRFGRSYRLRARVVDLAGNSLALDERSLGADEQASEEIVYRRFEPVDPPAIAHRTRVSEGESAERMVIRSDALQSASDYLKESIYNNNDPAVSGFAYGAENDRHFVPPKTSQMMAEQHGELDAAFGGGPAAIRAQFERISPREPRTLYHDPSARVAQAPGATPDPAAVLKPGDEGFRLKPGEYVVHDAERVATPYLPDPLAAGVSFRGLPGVPLVNKRVYLDEPLNTVWIDLIPGSEESYLFVSYAGQWPERDGFRLRIEERAQEIDPDPCKEKFQDAAEASAPFFGGGQPVWDPRERVLRVFLRKGEIAPVRYSSGLRPRARDRNGQFIEPEYLGLPAWVPGGDSDTRVRARAEAGAHWMITPDRSLTLVHATQHPICPPTFEKLFVLRESGWTHADLTRPLVRLHARTSGKLEVLAEWMEWEDAPGSERPLRRRVSAQLPEVSVPQPAIGDAEPLRTMYDALAAATPDTSVLHYRHEFGDHKFRLVRYRLRATSRFREYLPRSLTAEDAALQTLGPEWLEDRIALPAGYNDETTDTSDLVARGAPVLRDANGTPAGAVVSATLRPAEPKLTYIVPTFRWSETSSSDGVQCTRLGNGLRVWLDRPWYSSGEGELLGVVVSGTAPRAGHQWQPGVPQSMERYVTQWGSDPLFASDLPRRTIEPSTFTARVHTGTATLVENGAPVIVAGHRVHWDDVRKQWFCDLQIDAGHSYTPFIRLALVRYQPNALAGCEISPVVLSDFAQLMPNRHVRMTRDGQRLRFLVYGPTPDRGTASDTTEFGRLPMGLDRLYGVGKGRNRIEIVLQTQDSGFDTDLDWKDSATLAAVSNDARPDDPDDPVFVDLSPFVPRTERIATRMGERGLEPQRIEMDRAADVSAMPIEIVQPAVQPSISVAHLHLDRIWSENVSVPSLAPGQRARLVLREYERHLADDEETLKIAGRSLYRPRTVERLVFAREFYVLGYEPPAD